MARRRSGSPPATASACPSGGTRGRRSAAPSTPRTRTRSAARPGAAGGGDRRAPARAEVAALLAADRHRGVAAQAPLAQRAHPGDRSARRRAAASSPAVTRHPQPARREQRRPASAAAARPGRPARGRSNSPRSGQRSIGRPARRHAAARRRPRTRRGRQQRPATSASTQRDRRATSRTRSRPAPGDADRIVERDQRGVRAGGAGGCSDGGRRRRPWAGEPLAARCLEPSHLEPGEVRGVLLQRLLDRQLQRRPRGGATVAAALKREARDAVIECRAAATFAAVGLHVGPHRVQRLQHPVTSGTG